MVIIKEPRITLDNKNGNLETIIQHKQNDGKKNRAKYYNNKKDCSTIITFSGINIDLTTYKNQ